jgi:hypothetical protein
MNNTAGSFVSLRMTVRTSQEDRRDLPGMTPGEG